MSTLLNNEIEEELHEDILEFQNFYNNGGLTNVIEEINREGMSSEQDAEFILIVDSQGKIIHSTDLSYWAELDIDQKRLSQLKTKDDVQLLSLNLDSQEYESKTILAKLDDNTLIFLGESTEENQEVLELLLIIFASMLLITIPITAIVMQILSKKAVAGISEVSNAAVEIERGQFDRRAQVYSSDREIQQLADTFNSMADRIRGLISEMREMIDNIAHDLRSPIARIRAISESTLATKQDLSKLDYQTAVMDTLEECDRLINLINTTLDVAEVEANISNPEKHQIDFSNLVADAVELFEPLAENKSIAFSRDIAANLTVYGNQHNLQRMVINLIDNAIKYSKIEGQVDVILSSDKNQINCKVTDDGIGIPEHDLGKIFQRFYRSDSSRAEQGCGLGLSFSRAVARAHGGDINVTSRFEMGSTFTVILPCAS